MRGNRFIWLLFMVALGYASGVRAQQLPIYSQYVMNGFQLNPAIAGADGYTSVNATARQQWIGFDGAPQTFSASYQARLYRRSYRVINKPHRKNKLRKSTQGRVGLGAYVINDINGRTSRTGASFTYAYHMRVGSLQQVSFGLALKALQYRVATEGLTLGQPGDPIMTGDVRMVGYSPDADAGVYFTDPKFFLGFSISNLLQTPTIVGGAEMVDFKSYRTYWVMGGYDLDLSQDLTLRPQVLMKTSENWNPQADLSLKLDYAGNLWGGLSYRTDNTLILLFGVRIENIYFGYSFDYSLKEVMRFNHGSHEVALSVKIGDNARRYKWKNRY